MLFQSSSQCLGKRKPIVRTKVVIIGAGAAGMAAAERLQEKGELDFYVLEASDRIGGRVLSTTVGKGPEKSEHGAQWIPEGTAPYKLARKYGMLDLDDDNKGSLDLGGFAFLVNNGEMADLETTGEIAYEFLKIDTEIAGNGNKSKGEIFTSKIKELAAQGTLEGAKEETFRYLKFWARVEAGVAAAATWFDVASIQNELGNTEFKLNKDTNVQALIERLGSDVKDRIVFNENVLKVHKLDDTLYKVETKDTIYQSEFVITTVSLGVLKANHIKFIPELPKEKQEAIDLLGYGVVDRLLLEYDNNIKDLYPGITNEGLSFLRVEDGDENAGPYLNLPTDPWQDSISNLVPDHLNPRVAFAILTGPAAMKIETLSNETLVDSMSEFLGQYLGPSHPLAKPRYGKTTKWSSNPFTRGSYSYPRPETPSDAPSHMAAPVRRLLFAGEATFPELGWLHGAIESGWREADRIIQMQ